MKELEQGEPPPPYASMIKDGKIEKLVNKIIPSILHMENKENPFHHHAYLCNFRCISSQIHTPQAHLKILPLHVNNSSYRPDVISNQSWNYNLISIMASVLQSQKENSLFRS